VLVGVAVAQMSAVVVHLECYDTAYIRSVQDRFSGPLAGHEGQQLDCSQCHAQLEGGSEG